MLPADYSRVRGAERNSPTRRSISLGPHPRGCGGGLAEQSRKVQGRSRPRAPAGTPQTTQKLPDLRRCRWSGFEPLGSLRDTFSNIPQRAQTLVTRWKRGSTGISDERQSPGFLTPAAR